jgi:hypothetical protein
MLAHSPPLPLVIDYKCDPTSGDEEGAFLALKQRDRVRRVRLSMPAANLQKLIEVMDDEYPILEYMILATGGPPYDRSSILILPETLQAPHLRHLTLSAFALPMGSRLLTAAVGLVSLCLYMDVPSTYFHPNALLHWISYMPQLETLVIAFFFPVPNREIERQLTHMPILTPVILPNLHCFMFQGVSAYLEAFIHQITTPRLEKFDIDFFNQLTFSVPRLVQFLNTSYATENLRFDSARFWFEDERVAAKVYTTSGEAKIDAFINVGCWHLDWQVSSMAQIFNSLSHLFSAVDHLTLKHKVHRLSSEDHNAVDHTEWRKLLGSFGNTKTLWVSSGLVEQLSRCLELEDGELPLELLPELQELTYSVSGNTGDAFTPFVNARQNADRAVTLVCRSPSPGRSASHIETSLPSITPAIIGASEAGSGFDT